MKPVELLRQAATLGLRLEVQGDKLAVVPGDQVPTEFAVLLREHKAELMAWMNSPPCPGWQVVPPPDLPLKPLMPRPSPANRERLIAYLRRQTADRPGPLTAWLVRRECAYYDGPGRHWDCGLFSYAAARDAASWQLNRGESEVLSLLADLEGVANDSK